MTHGAKSKVWSNGAMMSFNPLHMKRHRQRQRGSDCGDKAVAVAVAQQFTVGLKASAA